MPERPLLLLPEPIPVTRGKKGGGPGGPAMLGAERQQVRLGPRLEALEQALSLGRVQLHTSATGIVPEDVLVLETAGTVADFVKAVIKIDGFEFLTEYDQPDIPSDDDFYVADSNGERVPYSGRVYMVFTSQEAFRSLRSLWQRFQSGMAFTHGLTKWRDVFGMLRDIRLWGVQDRLEETGVIRDWDARIQQNAEQVHCEIELWFRANPERRLSATQIVRSRVVELGGLVLSEAVLPGIHYHGLAVWLPAAAVRQVLNAQTRNQVQLIQSEQIQFFRAAGQMAVGTKGETAPSHRDYRGPLPSGPSRIALFDGLPVQNHRALARRLNVDDPDGFETEYRVDARSHGTAMASMIIWGDLNDENCTPIPQPLYVRPIMRPVIPPDWTAQEPYEMVPDGMLAVDLVQRAVRRLFEADGNARPAAPEVALINLSIGVLDRPFSMALSPLARLLDWLSWKYGVLFVVSAGNHLHEVDTATPWSILQTLAPGDLSALILHSITADTRNRRALSPAEAMNALTIGALHQDQDTATHAGTRIDPLPAGYPSPLNAHGLGYRRSVKPDLLAPGGRLQFAKPIQNQETRLKLALTPTSPGVQVAAPGAVAGDLTHTTKSRGTSVAAAQVSRAGAFLAPVIAQLREGDGASVLSAVPDGILLKMLIAHGARWGELGTDLHSHFAAINNADKRTEQVTRLLGFGRIEIEDISECTAERVTCVGGGSLAANQGAQHRFPLPPSLSGRRGWRRLSVTLAWFTPINPLSQRWRQAHLWFEAPRSRLQVKRFGPDWKTAQRGTLQHDIFEGESASAFVDGDEIVVRVSCREDAPGLDSSVPYAVAVTLEIAADLGVDIYAEVSERVRARPRIASREGTQ